MSLVKSGQIANCCQPNALMTLMEYILDYGDEKLSENGKKLINAEIANIERQDIRALVTKNIELLKQGKRDLYL